MHGAMFDTYHLPWVYTKTEALHVSFLEAFIYNNIMFIVLFGSLFYRGWYEMRQDHIAEEAARNHRIKKYGYDPADKRPPWRQKVYPRNNQRNSQS